MANDVFPRNNLPPESVSWGRAIENETRDTAYTLAGLGGGIDANNRAFAGQAGSIQREVAELQARSTHVVDVGTRTIPVSLPANFDLVVTTGSSAVSCPPPSDGYPRKALIFVSGVAINQDPLNVSGTGSTAEVKVRINGIVSAPMAAPVFSSVPPGYLQSFYISTVLTGSSSFNLEIFVIASQATTPTARTFNVGVTECVATIVYQERV